MTARDTQIKNMVVGLLQDIGTSIDNPDTEAAALLLSLAPAESIRREMFEKLLLKYKHLIDTKDDSLFEHLAKENANNPVVKDAVQKIRGNWSKLSPNMQKRVWATLSTGLRLISR